MPNPRENDDYEKVSEDSHAFDYGDRDGIITAPRLKINLRDPTKIFYPPGWVPCTTCLKPWEAHVDRKCPFDATTFSPDIREVWETVHDAMALCGYETRSPLMDLTELARTQYYLEARRVRLDRQRKKRESR